MARVSDEVKTGARYAGDASSTRGRRADEPLRERRQGQSRLSTWTRRRLVIAGVAWVALVLALVTTAALVSLVRDGNAEDVRLTLTRSNLIGLGATLVAPPLCLAAQWWRMRNRRRTSDA
jgi:hypothetical protein